jgi:hypothetical protein
MSPVDPRRQTWLPYFRLIADSFGLKDWEFRISDEPPDSPSAFAEIQPCKGRKLATILLSGVFLGAKREEQRITAIHELLHCHYDLADRIVLNTLTGPEITAYRLALELAVDGIATAIASKFPLPKEPI